MACSVGPVREGVEEKSGGKKSDNGDAIIIYLGDPRLNNEGLTKYAEIAGRLKLDWKRLLDRRVPAYKQHENKC